MDLGQALTTNIDGGKIVQDTIAGTVIGSGIGLVGMATEAAVTAGTACAATNCVEQVKPVEQAIQNGLNQIQTGAGQGYQSFEAFKAAEGSAGSGMAWHHIVSQLPQNISRFGSQVINNTSNLIQLPDGAGSIHRQLTGITNSIDPMITGSNIIKVRDWLATQSFEAQWVFGMQLIEKLGGGQYIIDKFGK